MKFQPINVKLISHPMNWVVILLMLIIAGFAGHLILSWAGLTPATSADTYSNVPAGQAPLTPAQKLGF